MTRLPEYASRPLARFFEERKDKADYMCGCVELKKSREGKFRNGRAYPTSVDYELSVRIESLEKGEVKLFPAELDLPSPNVNKTLDVEFLIEQARRNPVETVIVVPSKKLRFPEKSYTGKITSVYLDSDFLDDLKVATKTDSQFPVSIEYSLVQRIIYQLDSNNVEAFHEIPNFLLEFKVYISPDEVISRKLGINPHNKTDIKYLHKLIRFLPDITPEQRLRDAEYYNELTEGLVGIAADISKNGHTLESGLYNIITPSGTPLHELGHLFEGEIRTRRISQEESKYSAKSRFGKNIRGLSIPKSLSLINNPLMDLEGEIDGIEGMRLFGGFDLDLEMFPAKKKVLIKKGEIEGRMLGSRYADVDEVGNAMSGLYFSIPCPRMSVLHVPSPRSGPKSIREMIEMASRKKALLTVKEIGECSLEESVMYTGKIGEDEKKMVEESVESYIVENGNLVPVRTPFHFNFTAYQSLSDIILSNKNLMCIESGYCGVEIPIEKNESNETDDDVPTSLVGPMSLIKHAQVITYEKMIEI